MSEIKTTETGELNNATPLTADKLTTGHAQLIVLNTKREELKESLKRIDAQINEILPFIEFDQLFQDDDGTVFMVEKPTGTFVEFKEWKIRRTRRQDEPTSSTRLAIKTVEEAGLIVKNKHVNKKS